ncbi:MAG: GNAT family protein [Kofleriaceae bacterium]
MTRASWLSRFSTLSLGEELLLRPVQEDDAPQLAAMVQRSRAHLTPFLGDLLERVYDEPTARAHLRAVGELRARDELLELHLVERGALCGALRLRSFDWREGNANLGYLLDARATGRGLATRAARALVAWVFAELPIDRVELRCAAGNAASVAVAGRLGFQREGTARAAERDGEGRRDVLVFSRLRTDPEPPARA